MDFLSLVDSVRERKLSGNCQRRKTLKRQKYLRKKPNNELTPGQRSRETKEEEEQEEVLLEAAEKLKTICTDFQSSLKYKKVKIFRFTKYFPVIFKIFKVIKIICLRLPAVRDCPCL